MTNTLDARNTTAMPVIWIPAAGIVAFIVRCSALFRAEAPALSLGWSYVKFVATFKTFFGEICGTHKGMLSQICGSCFWCCVALVRWALATHDLCNCAEIQMIIRCKLQKVFAVNHFAGWRNKGECLRVHAFSVYGFYCRNHACPSFWREVALFPRQGSGHFTSGVFAVFHAQLRGNIHASIVEAIAIFAEFIKPALLNCKCILWRAVLKWDELKSTFTIFVPCGLKMWSAMFVAPEQIPVFILAMSQATCGAANISRLSNDIQDHVNTGFIRVYVFHH